MSRLVVEALIDPNRVKVARTPRHRRSKRPSADYQRILTILAHTLAIETLERWGPKE